MGEVYPTPAVTSPVPYTTFTCWVPGDESSAAKRVSSLFRYWRSLPCVFRKFNMSIAFSLCVSSDILRISVETSPYGSRRVLP